MARNMVFCKIFPKSTLIFMQKGYLFWIPELETHNPTDINVDSKGNI